MSNYLIGDYIRDTRLRRGYTQEQLSFGNLYDSVAVPD